ncbi:MAG: single-stranded DNA-binding protein [Ginsengibacter sp.]
MEITARLTGDAKVTTVKNDKHVVNFNVAINDNYKAKGSNEVTKIVTYVQCDYWVNPGVAKFLTKGTLVELQGRIGINAYTGKVGDAKASLTFHVNTIKLHGKAKANDETPVMVDAAVAAVPADDLPF